MFLQYTQSQEGRGSVPLTLFTIKQPSVAFTLINWQTPDRILFVKFLSDKPFILFSLKLWVALSSDDRGLTASTTLYQQTVPRALDLALNICCIFMTFSLSELL